MKYSMSDVYPEKSNVLPTVDQTIPEDSTVVADTTSIHPNSDQKVTVNKNMIIGAVLLLVGLMVALHFLGGD